MGWLKEWDACVFKTSQSKKKAAAKTTSQPFGQDGQEHIDALGRPQNKVLILSGPPGLGKTTLAHVLAAQAGYQVMEINASDDKSTTTVQNKIRDALDTRAITSLSSMSNSKPTCLILDEIDGAGGGDQVGCSLQSVQVRS